MNAEDTKYYMKAIARGSSYLSLFFALSFFVLGWYGIFTGLTLTHLLGIIICAVMFGVFSMGTILLHAYGFNPEK